MTVVRASATLFVALMLAACMQVRSTFVQVSYEPSASEATSTALDRMASEFKGGYTPQQIQSRLDASFAVYGLPPTEDNYRRAADVLITLSNKAMTGACAACTEMAIVEVIAARTLPGATWDDAAALAVGVLAGSPPEIPQ